MKNAMLVLAASMGLGLQGKDPVGHWKFDDEKTSTSAADSSAGKNAATLMNGPAWTTGKVAGALNFDGKDDYVEIPNTKDLEDVQEGSFTLAAWFKPENAPPGTESANDAQYAIIIKTGWHTGLHYSGDKKFNFAFFIQGDPDPVWAGTGAYEMDYEPGSWYHVAGVVDKAGKVSRCYVNGELTGTSEEWAADAKTREYGQATWKIGAGGPGFANWAWHAKGAIDDVRIYNRALTAEEIKAVCEAGAAGK